MTNGPRRNPAQQPRTQARRNVSRNAPVHASARQSASRPGASRSQRPQHAGRAARRSPEQTSAPGFRQPALWTKEDQQRRSASSSRGRATRSYQQPARNGSSAAGVFQTLLSVVAAVLRLIGSCLLKVLGLLAALMRKSRVAFVAVVAACVIVVGLTVDGFATNGRAYQGVHVGTVDVSGMNAQEIAQALDEQYTQPLQGERATVFASDDAAAQTAEAAQEQNQQDAALAEQMAVDEAKASKQAWTADGASLGAHVDGQSLAASALAVGREDGGVLSRLKSQLFGTSVDVDVSFDDRALDDFLDKYI